MGARQTNPSGISLKYLDAHLLLDAMLDLCRDGGTGNYVGYPGGGVALRQASIGELRSTKWGYLSKGGVADPENWIPSMWFLEIVEAKLKPSD